MHNGYPSAEDAKIAQDNLQANGRRTLAALKGLVADGNGVTIDARKAEKALQDDAAVDARLEPAMRHRTIDLNFPPKSVTAPHSGPVGGEFPRLAYAQDGRFKRCADTREWDQLQREGWQFQPFEGFDYSSYFSLCHGVWQARTHEAAHQHRYEPEHGLKVTVVKK